jgi:hypothetical protein
MHPSTLLPIVITLSLRSMSPYGLMTVAALVLWGDQAEDRATLSARSPISDRFADQLRREPSGLFCCSHRDRLTKHGSQPD